MATTETLSVRLSIAATLISLLLCAACTRNTTYTIDGKYTTDDGTEVFLINLDSGDTLGVTTVDAGRFSFTGEIEEPAYVYVGRGKERIRFILQEGVTVADIDEREEFGTPMVEACNAYDEIFYGYDKLRREEREALNARRESLSPQEFNAAWDSLNNLCRERKMSLADSMIRNNSDNLVSAYVMNDVASVDPEAFLALYNVIAEPIRKSSLIEGPYERTKAIALTAPGKMFTDYTVPGGNPDGSDVRLSDYVGKGKYILLDHWASWCGPCKKEMPYIKKAWEAFRGEKFDVVSIAVSDKREDTEAALAKLDMPWNQILDAQKIPGEIYGINAIPHLILFAPDGTILRRDLRGEQIISALEEILKD